MIYPSNYKITSNPAYEPVTLLEAKEHLRVTDSNEDDYITSLIQVAREYCEKYEHRAYCLQTVTVHYDSFGSKMLLPMNPAISIESITYIDSAGDTQTLDTSLYELDNYSCPAFIYPAYNASYPSVRDITNTITVTYLAGYDSDPSNAEDVPERIKHAIKLIIGHLYENREETTEKSLNTIPMSAKNLLCERVFY